MKTIRRVLIVEPYGIGDLLFLTPVLRALRLLPGIERVDLLLGSRTEEVVRLNPHVDEWFVINKDLFHDRSFSENLKEIWKLSALLKKRSYDVMLDYSQRREYGAWGLALGIPIRAGLDFRRRGFFLNRKVPIPQGFTGRHVVDFYSEVAEKAGIRVEDRFLEYYLPAAAKEKAGKELREAGILEGYAVVAPGGGESWGRDAHFKRWPAEQFGILSENLCRERNLKGVVLIGSRSENELAEKTMAKIESVPKINLCGKTSLEGTAAVLSGAGLFIGNDGGLLHLAKALRIPVIGFYGPADPEVYGPYPRMDQDGVVIKKDLECRPCYQKFRYRSDCPHRNCLQDLSPEEALLYLKSLDSLKPSFLGGRVP